jgi:phenylpyruvate C(3)-methyltransferase
MLTDAGNRTRRSYRPGDRSGLPFPPGARSPTVEEDRSGGRDHGKETGMRNLTPTAVRARTASSAEIFNAAVAASAISASWELGLLDALAKGDVLDVAWYADANELHLETLTEIVRVLESFGILERRGDPSLVHRGRQFDEVMRTKGFFYWLTRGNGELFGSLPALARRPARVGDFVQRDLRAVGVATRDLGRIYVDPLFHALLERIPFTVVADLGCGSAERLIALARARPGTRGIGVDLAPAALRLAEQAVAAAGLRGRIRLLQGDAAALAARPELLEVDLVTCFFMGHDFWPRASCVRALRGIRTAMPGARQLILCDTSRLEGPTGGEPPIFALGFQLAHAAMGQYLPTLREWREVFRDGGWENVAEQHLPTPPATTIFQLRAI